MTARKAIRSMMRMLDYTQIKLAYLCGYKSQSNIGMLLKEDRGAFSTDALVKLVKAMDCELVIQSKSDPSLKWVIDELEEVKK